MLLQKFAIFLEEISRKLKKYCLNKEYNKYIAKYHLSDGKKTEKDKINYNSYEGTNISLLRKLIQSGEIKYDDKIIDVGCGAGIFISYLWLCGYKKITGIEINKNLYKLCISNLQKIGFNTDKIYNNDALEYKYEDDIDVFYLFNPFYDFSTYSEWLKLIYRSYLEKKRKIKIIILFPTTSSISALNECSWLKRKCRIYDENQVCYRCVNYLIYESEE